MSRWIRTVRNEGGVALPLALFALAILSAFLVVLLSMAGMEPFIAQSHTSTTGAFHIAEAGAEHARDVLPSTNINTLLQAGGVLFSGRAFGGGSYTVTVSNNVAPSFPRGNIPGDAGGATNDTDQILVLTAVGTYTGASRTIEVIVSRPPSGYGMFGRDRVRMTDGVDTDSYDSRLGPYNPETAGSAGSVGSNGNIEATGKAATPAIIKGNVSAGGKAILGKDVTVTGTVTNGAPPQSFPPVGPCGPYSGGSGITLSGGGTYNPATGGLKAAGSQTVTLAAGTYCFGKIDVSQGATFQVTGAVQIYVNGQILFTNRVSINNPGKPADLAIYSSLVSKKGDIDEDFHLSWGGEAHMTIYAPQADIRLTDGNHFYGSIIGEIVEVTQETKFHYDVSLETGASSTPFQVRTWREL